MSGTFDELQLNRSDRRLLTRRALLLGGVVSPVLLAACQSSAARPVFDEVGSSDPEPAGRQDSVIAKEVPAQVGSSLTEDERAIDHLLRRATFGVTPRARSAVAAIGITAWVDRQLDPWSIDDDATVETIAGIESVAMSAAELRESYGNQKGQLIGELTAAKFLRAMHSERQLFEVMVGFWNDHFNVDMTKRAVAFFKGTEEREVIRPNALGFADLLVASASSPAMLVYLDNAKSRADGDNAPNENYARELLELHTVGVNGGYDETDVVEVAHIFSGWTVSRRNAEMTFAPRWHSMDGVSEVLGWRPNGLTGQAAGEAFLDHLAHLPQTATTLATKLCRRFVADDPPSELVQRAAEEYLANDTEIAPVVRLILTSGEFVDSVGQKTKRPFEYLVALGRAIDLEFEAGRRNRSMQPVGLALRLLGEPVYTWPSPDGPPDVGPPWLNAGTMLQRWRVVLSLTTANLSGATVVVEPPSLGDDATAIELVEQFAHQLGIDIDAPTTKACLDLLGSKATDPAPSPDQSTLFDLAAVVLVSPGAHRR